jgi:YbbR domain-containing protein
MKNRAGGVLRYVVDDFSYKSVALAVALVLWVTMLGRKDITSVKKLPIQFLNDSTYEVAASKEKEVKVEVAGPRMALKKFSEMDQVYTLDLSGLKSGSHMVRLTSEGLSVPVGVKVLSIRPDSLNVTLKPLPARANP